MASAPIVEQISDRAVQAALGLVGANRVDEAPLDAHPLFPPHVGSRRWAWTHYGVMVPDLPDPHRFLACMSLVGTTGSRIFDTDHARVDGPRHSASLVMGTALTAPGHYRQYSTRYDCHLAADGSMVRLGEDMTITGTGRSRHLELSRDGFTASLDLRLTDAVTWFARGPVWQHLSVLSRYEGTVSMGDASSEVEGTGTFEWARSAGAHAVLPWSLPARLKAPAQTFDYCVITLSPGRQLLLSGFGGFGRPLLDAVYLRSEDAAPVRHVHGVTRAVVDPDGETDLTPDGRTARLPRVLRWTADGGRIDVTVTLEAPFIYGLGSGHVGGVRYEGHLGDEEISGRGYLEHIDRRAS